jgi:hypothetical protein
MLELPAARGMNCQVSTTRVFDRERETTRDVVLSTLELTAGRFLAELGSRKAV